MTKQRTCPICGSEFIPNTHNHKYCSRECAKTANLENSKRRIKDNHEWYVIWHREYQREYRKRHHKECNEHARNYYHNHKEKVKAYQRKYYLEHKAERNEYYRNYQKNKRADKCAMEHDNCFSCPTKDGNCLYE